MLETRLSPEELRDVLLLDLLVCGQPRTQPEAPDVWLAVEISAMVDKRDVERARRRADLLRQAGYRTIPMVAGERFTQGANEAIEAHRVAVLEDGNVVLWEQALQAWAGST